ncbi:MAG: DUF2800 domain-containing protein [Bacilli bacterium]|nr:DUF2800 domain-containing protein [Bacilli bacterium]
MPSPSKHSKLSPSKSNIWLNCSYSSLFMDGETNEKSEVAEFGTQCHELGAALISKALHVTNYDEEFKTIEEVKEGLSMYSAEMQDIADGYADYAVNAYEFEKKRSKQEPLVVIEQELDLSDIEEDGVGTLDLGIVSDRDGGTLTIIDLKTGRLPVYAKDPKTGKFNSQLGMYALYFYKTFKDLYQIKNIRLVIYQPVINNTNECEITLEELLNFEEKCLKPMVQRIKNGFHNPRCGDHCKYCPGRMLCRYRMLNDLWTLPFAEKEVNKLSEEEINAILPHLDGIISYAEDLKEYALKKALAGKKWDGFKLVYSKVTRKIIDEEQVIKICKEEGIDPFVSQKLAGITELTKRLGKEKFKELLGGYVALQEGSLVLVKNDDSREEVNIEEEKNNA